MDSQLREWASYSTFLGVVWRTYQPGTKHDEMVILQGAQGIGKSTFWANSIHKKIEANGSRTVSIWVYGLQMPRNK